MKGNKADRKKDNNLVNNKDNPKKKDNLKKKNKDNSPPSASESSPILQPQNSKETYLPKKKENEREAGTIDLPNTASPAAARRTLTDVLKAAAPSAFTTAATLPESAAVPSLAAPLTVLPESAAPSATLPETTVQIAPKPPFLEGVFKSEYGPKAGNTAVLNVSTVGYWEGLDRIILERIILVDNGREEELSSGFIEGGESPIKREFPNRLLSRSEISAKKHEYFLKLVYHDGVIKNTPLVTVDFSGQPVDFPPLNQLTNSDCLKVIYLTKLDCPASGESLPLKIYSFDGGDNAGINQVVLYEDGKILKRLSPQSKYVNRDLTISYNKPATHTYFSVAVDKGYNLTASDVITFTFTGKKKLINKPLKKPINEPVKKPLRRVRY